MTLRLADPHRCNLATISRPDDKTGLRQGADATILEFATFLHA
jgi:hypothetical protein